MYYASWWACWEFVAHRVHVEWLTGTTGSWEASVGQDTDAGVLPWREERAGGVSVCGRRLGPQRGYRLRHSTGGVCATTTPATKVCTLTRFSTLFTDSYCERVSSSVLSWMFYAFEGGFFNDPLYSDLDGWVADRGAGGLLAQHSWGRRFKSRQGWKYLSGLSILRSHLWPLWYTYWWPSKRKISGLRS